MHRIRSRQSQSLKTPAFALIALAGCAALIPGGVHRSPQFQTGNAPEPTIATAVVSCVSSALRPGAGDGMLAQFDALARSAMPTAPVPLSRNAQTVICRTVAASDDFHAWRETTPAASAVATIKELAQATGAKAIAMPVMRLYAKCEQDTKTVRDSTGATIATIQENTQTCSMDRVKDVGLFLFADDGTILYRATKRTGMGMGSREDPEKEMTEVLASIPATFSAATAGAASPPASVTATGAAPRAGFVAASAPAAPQGVGPTDPQIDSAIHQVNPKAPDDCKKFVKGMCRGASIPDASRLQMCTGYVASVNQLVQQRQKSQAVEACKSLLKSAPTD